MALDHSILKPGPAVQPLLPSQRFVRGLQLRDVIRQDQVAESEFNTARSNEQKRLAIQQAVQAAGGDVRKALPTIEQIDFTVGMKLREELQKQEKSSADLAKVRVDTQKTEGEISDKQKADATTKFNNLLTHAVTAPEMARPAIYRQLLEAAARAGVQLPTQYDPRYVQGLYRSRLTPEQLQKATAAQTETAGPGTLIRTLSPQGEELGRETVPFKDEPEVMTPETITVDGKGPVKALRDRGGKYFDATTRKAITGTVGVYERPYASTTTPAGLEDDIQAYVDSLAAGELQPMNVPQKIRGKVLEEARNQGVSILTDKERESITGMDTAGKILADIKKYSDKIHVNEGLAARTGGLLRRGAAAAGYDADVTALQSKAGELSLLIRALGEKGALAEGDVTRAISLIPVKTTYTKTEATNMLNDLEAIFEGVKGQRLDAATKTFQRPNASAVGGGDTTNAIRKRLGLPPKKN